MKRFNLTAKAVFFIAILFMIMVAWLFSGCARLQVGNISYLRIGNQSIDCKITTFVDGSIEVDFKQNSKTEVMKVLVDAASSYVK